MKSSLSASLYSAAELDVWEGRRDVALVVAGADCHGCGGLSAEDWSDADGLLGGLDGEREAGREDGRGGERDVEWLSGSGLELLGCGLVLKQSVRLCQQLEAERRVGLKQGLVQLELDLERVASGAHSALGVVKAGASLPIDKLNRDRGVEQRGRNTSH